MISPHAADVNHYTMPSTTVLTRSFAKDAHKTITTLNVIYQWNQHHASIALFPLRTERNSQQITAPPMAVANRKFVRCRTG